MMEYLPLSGLWKDLLGEHKEEEEEEEEEEELLQRILQIHYTHIIQHWKYSTLV